MISSPANFLYALGISDREVRKDKEMFFTRKLLAHQEAAAQYYIMWNLNRRVLEQVKNGNFFYQDKLQKGQNKKISTSFGLQNTVRK